VTHDDTGRRQGDHTNGGARDIDTVEPCTLADAHHALARFRPSQKAPLTEWLAYHQRSAALYAEVAEIDRSHHHEALFMAERDRQLMKEINAQISAQRPVCAQ
jgi:hypothetical protein